MLHPYDVATWTDQHLPGKFRLFFHILKARKNVCKDLFNMSPTVRAGPTRQDTTNYLKSVLIEKLFFFT